MHAGLNVFAWYGATPEEYERHCRKVIEAGPNVIIDDGGDLVSILHNDFPELIPNVIGGCEETTTGILRLQRLDREKKLGIPMVLVNNAECKHFFDNRYGTGQSVWDGINRTTNLIVAGNNPHSACSSFPRCHDTPHVSFCCPSRKESYCRSS